jgi:hypothetical protein
MRIIESHNVGVVIRILSLILILLSVTVVIPLTIKTFLDKGGPWGFGIIGLPILVPLSLYILFGFAGMMRTPALQRDIFITSHVVTFFAGVIILILLPVYPAWLVLFPIILAVAGILSRERYRVFLMVMIILGILINFLLLKWEVEFHRSLPILQLFQTQEFNP